MIGRGHGQLRFVAELMLIIHEGLVLSGEKQLADSSFKRDRPIVRLRCMLSPSIGVQVVHDVAAAEHENTFFSQDRQALAEFVVDRGWLCFINAKLNYWNIGLRVDV